MIISLLMVAVSDTLVPDATFAEGGVIDTSGNGATTTVVYSVSGQHTFGVMITWYVVVTVGFTVGL